MDLSCRVTDEHGSEWRKPGPIARPVFDRFVKGWSRDRPKATSAVLPLGGDPKVQLLTDPASKRPSRQMLLLWRNATTIANRKRVAHFLAKLQHASGRALMPRVFSLVNG